MAVFSANLKRKSIEKSHHRFSGSGGPETRPGGYVNKGKRTKGTLIRNFFPFLPEGTSIRSNGVLIDAPSEK